MLLPPWVKPVCFGVAAALVFSAGYYVADALGDKALAKARTDWAVAEQLRTEQALDQQKQSLASINKVETVYVQGAERVRTEIKTVTKEVIRYVQNPAVERVVLPAEWVRVHDLAASGVPAASPTPGSADGGAEAVDDAAALATVTANYGQCREYIEQINGLRAYAASISGVKM